ncbi:3-keto-disaccharide hydrolase [Novosphingobium terrae]|uniref:3-keto-disaccharide hydrolase n=1 Tax=Novosphingobium terrae TaxID=2726189 RepID=UPI00197FAE5B|nr:DUF1080 domain-containing protein [Novosphingobium terrae]
MKTILASLGLLACAAPAGAQKPVPNILPPLAGPPPLAHLPYDFDDHAGWQSMFDGVSLKGWRGTPGCWHVDQGAITCANPAGPSWLLWEGGDLANFEFKARIRLEGIGANSGLQFRATMLGKTDKANSEWESFGYQADYDDTNGKTGELAECCRTPQRGPVSRPDKAGLGTVVEMAADDAAKPRIVADLGDAEALRKTIRLGEWNELHLIARGTTILYILNGHVLSILIDTNPKRLLTSGKFLLQMEYLNRRGDVKVSFRDLWVKTLP